MNPTTTPRPERIASFGALLAELRAFVEGTWLPDVTVVGAAYADYYGLGAGPGSSPVRAFCASG